jgi:hypothetical protein
MDDFKPGDECYHKATNKKCVVILKNADGTIKVRNSDDEERDYHFVELRRPMSSIINRSPNSTRKPFFSEDDVF